MRDDFQSRDRTRNTFSSAVRAIPVIVLLLIATLVIQDGISQADMFAALFGCLFLITLSTFTLVSNQVKRRH
jgi:ABC-type nitrate/sulfonate/bicarbonate transport system permease component